ncbi:hypothetical protein RC62_1529 [Flavobacterium aquidurense]|uniref:Lipoprotein n=1 Tax=Flavobacterium aquidurense TaxID=362413 RepID=A0A0Q0RSZ0_9FLAO|nr:hypothetical protein RC62_1529 [Flavobacterium aquidurense]
MKKKTLIGIIIFPLFLISCTSQDSAEVLTTTNKTSFQKPGINLSGLSGPENNTNPYDSVGRLHNEVLEIYLSHTFDNALSTNTLTEDIMNEIQSITSSNTINIVEDCRSPFAYNTINALVTNPQNSAFDIIQNSVLTSSGKTSLTTFIDSVTGINSESYQDVYDFIKSYESEILSSTDLTNQDKRIILTTSSIVRYSVYYDMVKDRDWDTSVGNFIGGTVGALDSSLSPVTMALVTGIRYNNSIAN